MIDVSLDAGDFVMTNLAYGLYLGISIAMTVWVARALSSNGEVFLVRCFGQDTELAASTNRLLVIGFYLVNVGFISYRLGDWQVDTVDLIPEVGSRVGISVLVLGLMHFFNMMLIARLGRAAKDWVRGEKWSRRPRTASFLPPRGTSGLRCGSAAPRDPPRPL